MSTPSRTRRRRLRAVLPAVGLVGVAALAPLPATAQADEDKLRVYVVVVDGLNTEEVPLMPFLSSLIGEGTYYPEARSVMIAETTPNHVAMVTGVYPDKSGIVANSIPDVEAGEDAAPNSTPEQLQADSLFTLVESQCPDLFTAAVTSKDYLYTVMNHDRTASGEPDVDYNFHNSQDPTYIQVAGITPDERTLEVAREVVRRDDPDFLFVNLGAVDRSGHVDVTGNLEGPTGTRPAFRDTLRTITDTNLRLFVEELKLQGTWDSTALLVAVDHSMNWSLPDRFVTLSSAFEEEGLLAGEFLVAQNGGAALYSLKNRDDEQAEERLALMREIALDTDGVDEALYREPNAEDGGEEHWVGKVHPDWHQTHPRSGDLLVTVEDGWRVAEPSPPSNPIPGNHGMPSTLRIPMVVSGGADLGVVQQRIDASDDPLVREAQSAENIDVAPTVAWLMGIEEPAAGFDGRPLTEAFASQPAPVCAAGGPTTEVPGPTGPPTNPTPPTPSGARLPATGPALLVPLAGLALAAAGLAAARASRSSRRRL